MLKLFCVSGYKLHEGDPIINGHQTREMILEEANDIHSSDVLRLQTAIMRLSPIVENVYRINSVIDAAKEYHEILSSLKSDSVEACLKADRRFRAYVLEFDMFLDYWESYIAHHKRIDKSADDKLVTGYKALFNSLTHEAYDNHVEYQLLDMIRNQTAHVQSPVNRIHVGIDGNEAYSLRDVLLSKCKSGPNKKVILQAQPEEIVLSPIVDVTEQCLKTIHAGLIDYQIDEQVVEEMKYIGRFIGYAIGKNQLYQPWLLMDETTAPPRLQHIKDMKAYGYILERMEKKEYKTNGNDE